MFDINSRLHLVEIAIIWINFHSQQDLNSRGWNKLQSKLYNYSSQNMRKIQTENNRIHSDLFRGDDRRVHTSLLKTSSINLHGPFFALNFVISKCTSNSRVESGKQQEFSRDIINNHNNNTTISCLQWTTYFLCW